MYELTINITQNNVDNGMPESCGGCPLALALTDYFGPESDSTVSYMAIVRVGKKYGAESMLTMDYGDAGASFIARFDEEGIANPCSITFTFSQE